MLNFKEYFHISFLFGALLVFGCASTPSIKKAGCVKMSVDSIRSTKALYMRTYILLPADKDISISDLRFREFSKYIQNALKMQGFHAAKSKKDANIIIFLGYGVGDPKEHEYTYNVPILGMVQSGMVAHTSGKISTGFVRGSAAYGSTTTYTPQYQLGITGVGTKTKKTTSYLRHLFLSAFEWKDGDSGLGEKIWETTTLSRGKSTDLRFIFPYLVLGSKRWFGKNSPHSLPVSVSNYDPVLFDIKGPFRP